MVACLPGSRYDRKGRLSGVPSGGRVIGGRLFQLSPSTTWSPVQWKISSTCAKSRDWSYFNGTSASFSTLGMWITSSTLPRPQAHPTIGSMDRKPCVLTPWVPSMQSVWRGSITPRCFSPRLRSATATRSNTYGPRIGINDGRVIPNFMKQALGGKELTIYGDGSQTRSFCYVSEKL